MLRFSLQLLFSWYQINENYKNQTNNKKKPTFFILAKSFSRTTRVNLKWLEKLPDLKYEFLVFFILGWWFVICFSRGIWTQYCTQYMQLHHTQIYLSCSAGWQWQRFIDWDNTTIHVILTCTSISHTVFAIFLVKNILLNSPKIVLRICYFF